MRHPPATNPLTTGAGKTKTRAKHALVIFEEEPS